MPNNNFNIKSKKNIPTSPVLQNIDSNLSSVENPLFPGQKLSVGALQEINQLKTPTSPVLQNIGSPNTSQFISQPEISNQEEQDNSRFLASLLGQGVAMFGAGIAGRDPMRAGEIISDQRAYQERLNQQQKIQKEQKDLADNLMNPESKQSQRKRLLYSRALGVNIPEDVSASDLEDPVVLNSLKQQSIQAQMAKMPKQLGVAQAKQEKEKPSEKKLLGEYTEHAKSLQSSLNVIDAVKNLGRTTIGKYTPDISTSTKANVGTIDREAQPQVKVLAGPGAVTESERAAFLPLVTNSNMTADLGIETTKRTAIEGTSKAMAKLKADRDVGLISDSDFKKIINQYNQYLKNPKLELNKIINEEGDIVDSISTNKIKFSDL